MNAANLAKLKTELTTDPLARGYAALDDVSASDSINVENRQPDRESIDGGLLVASIVKAEFTALSAAEKAYLQLVVSAGTAIPVTPTLKSELSGMFPQGSQTRGNLLAAIKRPGSRGEELGIGKVTPSDVADARRLP